MGQSIKDEMTKLIAWEYLKRNFSLIVWHEIGFILNLFLRNYPFVGYEQKGEVKNDSNGKREREESKKSEGERERERKRHKMIKERNKQCKTKYETQAENEWRKESNGNERKKETNKRETKKRGE